MTVLVGILMYPPDFTGAGLRIHKLYSNLLKKGVKKVYVITTTSLNKFENNKRMYEGIEIIYVSIGNNNFKGNQKHLLLKLSKARLILNAFLKTILNYLKLRSEVDVIHTVDSSWLSSLVGWCAYFSKKPLVKEIVCLGTDDPLTLRKSKFFIFRYFFLFPFHYAKLIITISPPLKESCIKYGLSSDKIWCRFNPIYLTNSNAKKENKIPEYLDFSAKRILWVGIIIKRKNLEFLLNTAFYLKGRVQLIIVGPSREKEYFDEILSLSKKIEQDTNGRIKTSFLGIINDREELSLLYKYSHLFWFASHKEGLGNVVIESLICGTPVVTLPVDGIMEHLIQNSEDGEVVNTNDPRYFSEVVNKCLYNKSYEKDKIAERARKRFNSDQIENEYISKFNEIL